jgi:CDP-diglyceride synthetase
LFLPQNLSAPNSRWKNFWVRLIAGLVMMSIFTAIILMGHMVVVLLTLLTQIAVFKEVISIAHLQSKERHLKWFRTIAW